MRAYVIQLSAVMIISVSVFNWILIRSCKSKCTLYIIEVLCKDWLRLICMKCGQNVWNSDWEPQSGCDWGLDCALAGLPATYLDSTRIGKLILHSALWVFRISSKCAGSHHPQSSLHNDISALRLGNFRLYVKRGSQMSSMDSWLNLITTDALQSLEPASSQAVPSQERDGLDTTARSSPWLCSTVSLNWK